tara:strand:+ start:357 stop:1217 length:861 start_codon:yes stop_codon:yes gene_type:complete
MCLIIHKPAGKKIPADIIKRAKLVNPHGFGITYLDDGFTFKTMDYGKVAKAIDTDRALVCHFRYATVGNIDLNNAHPFNVGDSHVIYSNGTVEGFGNKTTSDIAHIAKDILPRLNKSDWQPFLDLTETRFCLIEKKSNKVSRVGFWLERDGVFYSKSNCFTPRARVAVYGTLKSGYHNHGLIEEQEFIGQGQTKSAYPLEVEGLPYMHDIKGEGSQVTVEVYDVSDECFDRLDMLEGHPSFYKRRMTTITMDDWSETRAWVYFIQERALSSRANLTSSYGSDENPW